MRSRSCLSRIVRGLLALILGFFALTVLWVLVLKWIPPITTPLMIVRSHELRAEGVKPVRDYRWVSYKKISPNLAKAVVASEDNLFFEHDGFDREAIKKAIEENKAGKRRRGGSSISQQTAKNVFCIPSKSYVRKGFEAYFTFLIERIWGKERIMEVYLNVIEMGKGIYGAEAAAQRHFGHDAAHLSRREACLIAACLPNPLKRNASSPGPYTSSRAGDISRLISKLKYPDWIEHK